MEESKFPADTLLHSYKKSFNGFVAKLTEEAAVRMAGLDGVVSVFPNKKNELHTTRSWDFIGLSQSVERTSTESDIIIGVIDSGIWPESDSFNDQGFGPPPKKWKGSCHNFTCNNKIIGAKYFNMRDSYEKDDFISPRDADGHGTHCASTAAGNSVKSTSFFGLASGTARGGVPSARIAVYKPCWSSGCEDADILQAYDEAIEDGVDIISISLGPSEVVHNSYFNDTFAIGSFHAMKKGILTSTSAGNKGPELYTISKNAPWSLSVAASTIDRKFFTSVQLGDGTVYQGVSVNTFDLKNESYPFIYGRNAPNISGGYNSSISRYQNLILLSSNNFTITLSEFQYFILTLSLHRLCLENSLDENLVKGKIVLCDGFQGPSSLGLVSGAAGILLRSSVPKDVAFIYALPAVVIGLVDGAIIQSYINLSSNPTATIFKSNELKDSLAPYIVSFSSRGPNAITPNILKPDLAAPGVNILAAWSPVSPVSDVKGDTRIADYNILSGTSMACPHATAAAVYVKSFHPDWSPAAIKSALMTTATPMSALLNPEAEFAYGAGQINPMKALNPGLVYDANESDYVNFLCGQGYDTKKLRTITNDHSSCTQPKNGMVWDLNLPSFALSMSTSTPFSHTFHRTVTNVGTNTSTYKARITAPPSLLKFKVEPDVISFSSVGQKKSFTLVIEGTLNAEIVSSSLIWDDGTFQVRSPIVVFTA
ncbi:cucumisin-like isoform X3 [Phaseolus vulgaris]|uniref:cucumisin-like isoform X3 n=1 Tax=Phaseolus vulgaris TaxID=3885 RepID=UPI0035CB2AA2